MRSTDNGKSFSEIEQKLAAALSKGKHSTDYGSILKIVKTGAENQFIYLLGTKEYSFYSKDCGDTFRVIKHEKGMIDLKPNNSNEKEFLLF